MLTLIVARAKNGAIGKGNTIPWHAPEDLALFQKETLGGAIIMGRNTWNSLPVKPLKSRLNLVISSQEDIAEHVFRNTDDAIAYAKSQGIPRIYGIGGQRIYQELLPKAHRLLVTEVDLEIEDADAFFPQFSPDEWELITENEVRKSAPTCLLNEYLRRTR